MIPQARHRHATVASQGITGARVLSAAVVLCLALAVSACASKGLSSEDRQEAARINTQLGADYLRRGQFVQAEDKLKRALHYAPDMSVTWSVMGVLHQRLGEPDKAEQAFRKALALAPGDASARNNLGVFLCERERQAEGVKLLLAAAESPRYATPEAAWTNAAVCLRDSAPVEAEGYLVKALEHDPSFPDALAQLAAISLSRQDAVRARALLERYEAVAPPTAETLLLRVRAERALGNPEAAARYLLRLKADFPESPEAVQKPNS